MQVNQVSRNATGLNRVTLTVQLIAENRKEQEAIDKTSNGTATNEQTSMLEKHINKYCSSITDHFILINARVNSDGMTEIVLEQTGNITV